MYWVEQVMLAVTGCSLLTLSNSQDTAQGANEASSLSSIKSILHHVTNFKLDELKRQKTLLNNHFQPILDQVSNSGTANPRDALLLLVTGQTNSPIKDIFSLSEIEKVKTLIRNAEQDPSISNELLNTLMEKLKEEIYYSLRKCDYSYLYGTLLKEWLDVQKQRALATTNSNLTTQDQNSTHKVKEAKELSKFKEVMLSSTVFDVLPFKNLLKDKLFNFGEDVEKSREFDTIQKATPVTFKFEEHDISVEDLRQCMRGLIASDLLSTEKKGALRELTENSEALTDVASLLTSTLRNLDRWEWNTFSTAENVLITRGLTAEYKVKLDEDILTALFLQYIGVYWAAYFKAQFLNMYNGKLWKNNDHDSYGSIDQIRTDFHRNAFLTTLPTSMSSQENTQLDEYVKIVSNFGPQYQIEGEDGGISQIENFEPITTPSPSAGYTYRTHQKQQYGGKLSLPARTVDIDFKQKFLHILSTEIRLNQVLRPNSTMTVVKTEFKSFTSSIPHEPILATMEFFGVTKPWLRFFQKFLKPKVKFPGDKSIHQVRRGVPSDHVLSQLFSESLLFLMEFYLNSQVHKAPLYRISDEFWYWNHNTTQTLLAWNTVIEFTKLVGLKLNENRSGSLLIFSDEELRKRGLIDTKIPKKSGPKPLPQRGIHWGYLNLYSDGSFKIDQNSTTDFITEMKGHLKKSESVLDWILAYNKYMPFFIRNFGKSALVLGTQHQNQIIGSLKQLHEDVFGMVQVSTNGSISGNPLCALKEKFSSLLDMNVIDAWVYWPLEKGGLGLVNPFISIMLLRETYELRNDTSCFNDLLLQDKIEYEKLKKIHEENLEEHKNGIQYTKYGGNPYPRKAFDTWEEYIEKRESSLIYWGTRYNALLEVLEPIRPTVSGLYPRNLYDGTNEEERNYFMSLFNYYEHQLLKHFGSIDFINTQLLPISLINKANQKMQNVFSKSAKKYSNMFLF